MLRKFQPIEDKNLMFGAVHLIIFQPGGDGVLIIGFDEGTTRTHGGGQVAWVIVGPRVKAYRSTTFYQHQNTLRLMLEGLGVTKFPQASATATDMSEFFK
jgi:hypothetical protein